MGKYRFRLIQGAEHDIAETVWSQGSSGVVKSSRICPACSLTLYGQITKVKGGSRTKTLLRCPYCQVYYESIMTSLDKDMKVHELTLTGWEVKRQ